MGFKIGDRVRFKPEYAREGYASGIVTALGIHGDDAAVVFDNVENLGTWFTWALELAPEPRGPKPLTLTGGTRFTVRNGWTTREPRDRTGRRFYESGGYR